MGQVKANQTSSICDDRADIIELQLALQSRDDRDRDGDIIDKMSQILDEISLKIAKHQPKEDQQKFKDIETKLAKIADDQQ